MYIDKRLQVSSDQALTATAASTDHIDLTHSQLVGPGTPMWLVVAFKAALAGTSPTIAVSIQTDDAANFPSARTLVTSETLTAAAIGDRIVVPFPYANERYLRASFTLGGTSPTATVDAWFTSQEPTTWKAFPDAI